MEQRRGLDADRQQRIKDAEDLVHRNILARDRTDAMMLAYSPIWMAVIIAVVYFEWYTMFSATGYVVLGVVLAAPCVLTPQAYQTDTDRKRPLAERYWVRLNVWIGIIVFIASYFVGVFPAFGTRRRLVTARY